MVATTSGERIAGALLGAAIGDAMGAATELRTHAQIVEYFGGDVTTFVAPPDDTFARGEQPGTVTDDFSQAYYLAQAIVAAGGRLDEATGKAAVLAWADDDRFLKYAGPTTKAAIARLRGEVVEEPFFLYRGGQTTNGAAMRISPVGMVATSADDAIDSAIEVSLPTHDNHLAVAAAASIAAGVWAGVDGLAQSQSPGQWSQPIAEVCFEAAVVAETRAMIRTHEVAGASVAARMRLALDLAEASHDVAEAAERIAAVVGTGLAAAEAVPAAVGILAAADDPMSAIIAAVNAGNDTDTVATMVGALAGSITGPAAFPKDLVDTVQQVNQMDLVELAAQLATVGDQRRASQ